MPHGDHLTDRDIVLLVDGEEIPLLEVRTLEMQAAGGASQ